MNSCQQKAMEKLLHGHGCANQLLIMDQTESDSSMEREDLAKSVLHCFSDALSILIDTNDHQDDQSNNSSPQDSSPVLESSRKPLHKRGRHLWQRAQTTIDTNLQPRSTTTASSGGNTDKSRSKNLSTKGVTTSVPTQKIQHNPPLYSTTYFGQHICQLHQAYATFPIDTSDFEEHEGSHMIRFGHPNISFSSSTSNLRQHQNHQDRIKDEYMKPVIAEDWSPSQWMSSEVALAVEAFEFNPFWTSHDLSS
ncbi:hypothetical protein AtEden1_Chr5g0083751 [Arabidopsis thaliana]